MLANKTTLLTQPQMHEARVTDDDALQPQQFVEIDGAAAGFADNPAPVRMFVLDREAGLGILQQQEGGRAR